MAGRTSGGWPPKRALGIGRPSNWMPPADWTSAPRGGDVSVRSDPS